MLGKEIKMEKKTYVSAEINIVNLNENDVIRTSGELPGINLPDIELTSFSAVMQDNSDI